MPTIPINDSLGVSLTPQLAPASALLKYARQIPDMVLHGSSIAGLKALTLADPAVRSLDTQLVFKDPLQLATDAPLLTISGDAGILFRVLSSGSLFDPDDFGDNIAIPAGRCFVALVLDASAGAGVSTASGALIFGLGAAAKLAITSFRPFSSGADAPNVAAALAQAIGELVLPFTPDDLAAMPLGVVTTVSGTGSLKFSGQANLLAIANPLATLSLPAPISALSLNQTAAVCVGASWELSGELQVRVQKVDAERVRLGCYRKHGSEFSVTASATAGIAGSLGQTDLFPSLVGAISTDAQAAHAELANLPPAQASAIKQAVKSAVDRKLELAVAAQLSLLEDDDAAFLYDVRLPELSDDGREALALAMRGDFSGLTAAKLPVGIVEIRNILTKVRETSITLKLNLLGILNFASISKLTVKGTVTYTPSTGDLAIVDEVTAARIQVSEVNFGANEDKLRQVMAESFLATAAYRASPTRTAPPELTSSHVFFRVDDSTSLPELRRDLAAASALALNPPTPPQDVASFGRTCTTAEARYDDQLMHRLFLAPDGTARARDEYEAAGRRALAMLVLPDGDDRFRLLPTADDDLWRRMNDLGPANFEQLFPALQAAVIRADYVTIQWWADSMRSTAEFLVSMNRAFASKPGMHPDDPDFQELRNNLAAHLKGVAAKATVLFGEPWGLVAMFLASGSRAITEAHITGPRFVYVDSRPLAAAG